MGTWLDSKMIKELKVKKGINEYRVDKGDRSFYCPRTPELDNVYDAGVDDVAFQAVIERISNPKKLNRKDMRTRIKQTKSFYKQMAKKYKGALNPVAEDANKTIEEIKESVQEVLQDSLNVQPDAETKPAE